MKTPLPSLLRLAAALLLAAAPAFAAEPTPRSILVLDASGSMWGQIEGRPKIAIARDAVDAMLDGWNGGDLGLMAYGHRRKGDCGDIELLIAPSGFDAAAIRAQADALNPQGMTPITAAVRQAAETLRHTEQKATLILVSDGEETCNADPCALGADSHSSLRRTFGGVARAILGWMTGPRSVRGRKWPRSRRRFFAMFAVVRETQNSRRSLDFGQKSTNCSDHSFCRAGP